MTAVAFPQANQIYGPPEGMDESQVQSLAVHVGAVAGGSVDGARVIVAAYKPSEQELRDLNAGKPIFVSFLGTLPPHFLSTDFHSATHPQ